MWGTQSHCIHSGGSHRFLLLPSHWLSLCCLSLCFTPTALQNSNIVLWLSLCCLVRPATGYSTLTATICTQAAAANLNLAMSVQIYSKLHPKNKSSGVHPCPKPDPWYEVPSELPKPGHESSSAAVIEMIQKVTADKAQRILLSERFDAKDAHTVAAWAAAGKQVGLLLELAAPPNGQADRWDRLGSVSLERTPGWANRRHQFPTGPLLIGYANWGQCNEQIMQAVNSGVNVLVWFSLNLVVDSATGLPTVAGPASSAGFLGCVAKMATEIKRAKKQVTHLVSIGGWNSPHPGAPTCLCWLFALVLLEHPSMPFRKLPANCRLSTMFAQLTSLFPPAAISGKPQPVATECLNLVHVKCSIIPASLHHSQPTACLLTQPLNVRSTVWSPSVVGCIAALERTFRR